jgi:hypothetical protein
MFYFIFSVLVVNVSSAVQVGRFWTLNVTSNIRKKTENQTTEGVRHRVLVPCKCSQLKKAPAQYVLLTRSSAAPGRLLRLGDDDFILPRKEKTCSVIYSLQAKCKSKKERFVKEMKKRMQKWADNVLYKLLQLKKSIDSEY